MLQISDLRPKQLEAIQFILDGYEALILADVGTGKTVITLTALFKLMKEGSISRALVLAPKRVATDVWVQEVDQWAHLKDAPFKVVCIAGLSTEKRIEAIKNTKNDVVVLNYENLAWFMERFKTSPFDALVLDEIDKMKDRTSKRFGGVKKEGKWVQEGLKNYRRQFDTIIGLTGTPASNGLLDLWAECYLVDGGASLGRSFNKFQRSYFYPTDYNQKTWKVLPTYEEKIYAAMALITFRIERDEAIPPLVNLPPRWVRLPDKCMKLYRKFERELLVYLEAEKVSIESPHAAAAYGRLREMAAGFSYTQLNPDHPWAELCGTDLPQNSPMGGIGGVGKHTIWHHSLKIRELDDLISELQGQQLLIIYHFRAQLQQLREHYGKRLQYIGGGITDTQARETIEAWNSGKLELLAIHPASAGHGLNLQKSGAKHVVLLTLPDSAGLTEQVIGRLRRTGSTADSIFVHRILAKDTVDEDRMEVVNGKILTQQYLLDAMKKRCGDG